MDGAAALWAREEAVVVLIVDDDEESLTLLERLLQQEGLAVVRASHGQEAVEQFEAHHPALVFMDVMMPGMDGLRAAEAIKARSGEQLTPVIFLTALEGRQEEADCLQHGGDDYLVKPVHKRVLRARLNAWLRNVRLASSVKAHRDQLVFERDFIATLLEGIRRSDVFEEAGLSFRMTSVENSTGDLLLSASRPDGVRHLLLGDFTGHGLAAAMGTPQASDVFFTMTRRGFGVEEILRQMNHRLYGRLPTMMYLAAVMVSHDPWRGLLKLWNGGMPELLLFHEGRLRERIGSRRLPVSVVDETVFDASCAIYPVEPGDHLFLCSDGVTELTNPEGEMFGEERLEALLSESFRRGEGLERVYAGLNDWRGALAPHDDLSMALFRCDPPPPPPPPPLRRSGAEEPLRLDWELTETVRASLLQSSDWLPQLGERVGGHPQLHACRSSLYVILKELVENALQHGLLHLPPRRGVDPEAWEGMVQHALSVLGEGMIRIHVEHRVPLSGSGRGEVILWVQNSGAAGEPETWREGVGLARVRGMCRELSFSDGGRTAQAVFGCCD
ncbi:MAG: SpoIIE family protein phosphatase [Magnetococcales bacterium]|nr:SpoIIE family protein phosphatase [Magnetococcales bacterium]